MDTIKIKNLIAFANHGVFQEEKKLGQKFLIDIEIKLDTQKSAISKNLEKTVNYGILSQEIDKLFKMESFDLIETCAEEIALFILKTYAMVLETIVEVKKPWAPIGLPLDEVSVKIHRKRNRAFLGLGSNLGDSKLQLEKAREYIESEYTRILNLSDLYKTKAWGYENQPDFLNQVIEIETFLEPHALLEDLQGIENKMGRERKIHWGPRTIDIDILFFNDYQLYDEDLIIPHPYIQERAFVLEPLTEIAPHFIHPVSKKPIRELLKEINEKDSKNQA
ncbi:MAG: 2-amino-4-hydroxy-6-hydroxymethyldihydropteridine diphosphokinase [Tissierellia bacterium]|nr:2-amino-4-hydroxy-6-hydroxymethyldihydropteridine diphosphokinase [Tissierellia bacterium]